MSTLPAQAETPILRRAAAARYAVRRYNADPHLALYWTIWPSERIEAAMRGEIVKFQGGPDPKGVRPRRRPGEAA